MLSQKVAQDKDIENDDDVQGKNKNLETGLAHWVAVQVALHNNGTLLRSCYRYAGPTKNLPAIVWSHSKWIHSDFIFTSHQKRSSGSCNDVTDLTRTLAFPKICGYELKVHTGEEDKVAIFALRKAFLLLLLQVPAPMAFHQFRKTLHSGFWKRIRDICVTFSLFFYFLFFILSPPPSQNPAWLSVQWQVGWPSARRFTVGHLLYFGNPMQFKTRGESTCACAAHTQ